MQIKPGSTDCRSSPSTATPSHAAWPPEKSFGRFQRPPRPRNTDFGRGPFFCRFAAGGPSKKPPPPTPTDARSVFWPPQRKTHQIGSRSSQSVSGLPGRKQFSASTWVKLGRFFRTRIDSRLSPKLFLFPRGARPMRRRLRPHKHQKNAVRRIMPDMRHRASRRRP